MYTFSPESEGTTELKGIVRVKNPENPNAAPKIFQFHSQYKSAKPAVVVAPEKMNVFYRGLDNPVAVSVPGIAAEDLVVGMSPGTGTVVKKSNGEYSVRVTSAERCTVNVSAKTSDGTVRSMGKGVEFRIKSVPNPVPEVYGKRGSNVIRQAELQFITTVASKLEDFVFKLEMPVVSFSVGVYVNGILVPKDAIGSSLSPDQRNLVKSARRGNKVYFENIKVRKPDGRIENIGNVILTVI